MQEQILEALRRGAIAEAVTLARQAVSAAPQDAAPHRLLALALRASGDIQGARDSLDQAIALAPDDADLHFQRAGFLIGEHDMAGAHAELARTVALDPNQFAAYVLQAQLALGAGDLPEAERLQRLAARIAPEHPWLAAITGTVALRRGDADAALQILGDAIKRAPDDAQLQYALGFAYLAKDHLAFAEQSFRRVLETSPGATGVRTLLADLLRRQERYAEAADELAPLLAEPATATPGLQRFAGELELMAGRAERALPVLREAFAAQPADPRTLQAMMEAWGRLQAVDEARPALDRALAGHAGVDALWRARLALEKDLDAARVVIARWIAARPDYVPALEARMAYEAMAGDDAAANATAAQIIAIEPGRSSAEMRLIEHLLQTDPAAAAARVEALMARTASGDSRSLLRNWLGLAQHRAGLPGEAVASWSGLHEELSPQRLPLPDSSTPRSEWPPLAPRRAEAPAVAFLWGPPGSAVERLALVLEGTVESFRADRYGATPPADPLQSYLTVPRLASNELEPEALVAGWAAALPARGIGNGEVVDWLLWWDNALLLAMRPHLADADLVIALRDPRDMLLDWLAFGAPAPFALTSPTAVARWLAVLLDQVAVLHEQDLFPHHLLRLDDIVNDPAALASAMSQALGTPLPEPPAHALGPKRFVAGSWRGYAQALAEPFAMLSRVARRLGYPEH